MPKAGRCPKYCFFLKYARKIADFLVESRILSVTEGRNMHQSGVKGFGRKVGRCYHTCLIGIDGIDTVVQNLGNDFIMGNAEAKDKVWSMLTPKPKLPNSLRMASSSSSAMARPSMPSVRK